MTEPLIIVDVQEGFINDYTRHVPERIARLVAEGKYQPIIFTRFVNVDGSPYRRILDWHGCAEEDETRICASLEELSTKGDIYIKAGHTGLSQQMREELSKRQFRRVAVAGIDTDMCVLKTAMDLFDLGIEPLVLIDCCASTAGLQAHLAGLAILSRNIGVHALRYTGLGNGYLAAQPS